MKLVRFGPPGAERPGIVAADGSIRDLSGRLPNDAEDLSGDVLGDLQRLEALDPMTLPEISPTERLGCPVGQIGKFICIGLNYSDHAAESGMPVPEEPVVFMKATSAVCGPNDPILLPNGSEKTDWEVELGLVIGKTAKHVSREAAYAHVSGYCVVNDVSERAFQIEGTGQWTKGKSCDNFGQTGPWLVTPNEISDPCALSLWLDVNGERMQSGHTGNMIYDVPFLISYLSDYFTLHPGDIIATGTPPGVGMGKSPPRYLKEGDVVELGIDRLGSQRQRVCRENG